MLEIARLDGGSASFELEFLERESTPEPLMKLSTHLHAAGLSPSDTVFIFVMFDVDHVRSTIHNWVRNADLEPAGGKSPNRVAIDESVMHLDGERRWLYAAVDPKTNEFPHVGVYNRWVAMYSTQFIAALLEKTPRRRVFLVDGAPWWHAALHRLGCEFRHETHGRCNAAERVFKELHRRTNQFASHFRLATIDSAESWLQTLAFVWNQLI